MKNNKAVLGALLIFIAAAAAKSTPSIARADENASTSGDCTLPASDFTAIQAFQDNPNLTATQELSQELALRKQLLAETISCAQNQAQSLQQTLNSVSATGAAATIQSQLSGNIDDALTFYGIESAKLNDAGISGTETIAKDLIAWRAANYVPLEGQIDNFILWWQNQALFQTAASRFSQTSQLIAFIESAAADNDLQASFDSAQGEFENAQSNNAAAQNALAQFEQPTQSLALIQQSLQSLADAYQKLSDLNVLIQKLLPTNQ